MDGIGSEFVDQEHRGMDIQIEDFIIWYYTETNGNALVDKLSNKFSELDVLEHYGYAWKLVVSRDKHSIG